MRNEWELTDDGDVRIWLQVVKGERLYTLVSFASLVKLLELDVRWYAMWMDNCWRVGTRDYEYVNGKRRRTKRTLYLSRFLMDTPPGLVCDHINGCSTDNRLSNLRNVTIRENAQNKPLIQKNSTTGVRGVTLVKETGKYKGVVQLDKVKHYVGLFETIDEASAAVQAFRREYMPYSALDQGYPYRTVEQKDGIPF